ncbi:MAG: peptidase MA family metallohydrolase [Chloroflexi bacterium]|nr:peptidase MA family metallohydrolase [Chloroflexota bacterium]MCL5110081.1 peptidase MA family metallohydrolase [Chloroflexota bacterium]
MRRAVLLALLLSLLPSSTFAQAVAPPAAGIEVVSQSQTAHFPTEIVFLLNVRDEANLVRATLRLKVTGQAVITANQVRFSPARGISLRHSWDLQKYYLPPGVDLEYHWLLEDAAGRTLRTQPVTFPLRDDRFAWRSTRAGTLEVNWYAGDQAFGEALLGAGRAALDQLAADAGARSDGQVRVYIYGNQRDLLSALRPSAQEWTGGVAFSAEGLVLVSVEASQSGLDYGRRVLPHELTHVVVGRATENPYGDLPRWLDEGLATYAEGELDGTFQAALRDAVRSNQLISVRSLSANFPTDPAAARLSYAQSQSLVAFLIGQFGRERVQRLLAIFKDGATADEALQGAFGFDSDGLEVAWRAAIGAPPAPPLDQAAAEPAQAQGLPLLPAAPLALALVLVLLAVLLLARRRSTKSQA